MLAGSTYSNIQDSKLGCLSSTVTAQVQGCAQAKTQRRHSCSPASPLKALKQVRASGCPFSHAWCRLLQVLSEQVIHNESRIAKTRVVVNFNKPRVMQFTWGVRYQDFDQVRQHTHRCDPGPPGQREQPCSA